MTCLRSIARRRLRPVAAPLGVGLVAAMMSGCVLNSPPDTAELKEQALPQVKVPEQWALAPAAGATPGAAADNWLAAFNDAALAKAVEEALIYNSDLRIGAARVEQAQLHARLAGAKLYPSVDFLARGGGKMSGDGSGLQGGVLTAAWELDLWGRVRYGRAASAAQAMSAEADFEYARQSIAALVAKSWFLAIEAGLQIEAAKETIRANEELVRMAEERARVGVGDQSEVFVARAGIGSYRDALRQLELGRTEAIRALELLIGRYPAAALSPSPQLPGLPDEVPAGLPSELLERRPDVIAAERRVAAAFYRIGEAKAARLPTISLTTGLSAISSELFVLKNRDNPIWNLGASLARTHLQGRRAQHADRYPHCGTEAGRGRICGGGIARLQRGRRRAGGRDRVARPGADPDAVGLGQRAGAEHGADPVQGGQYRSPVRRAATARPDLDPLRTDPRANRAAHPACEPSPGARRQLRPEARAANDAAAGKVSPHPVR